MHPTAMYGPSKKMFICRTEEELKYFQDMGWKGSPAELKSPYPAGEAEWITDVPRETITVKNGPRR